jgi:membrane protein implicated in regulation of membrane protease activity
MEKGRSVLETPRAAIERGRSNPLLAIAAIAGALLLIAWIAWAIYVTNDNGASAGLGVLLSWPVLIAALVVVASPFVGLYFLVRVLRPSDEADRSPSISGGSAGAEAETEEKPAGESEDETADDEESDEEAEDEDEPEETDPDEEPPSGEKETSVSG